MPRKTTTHHQDSPASSSHETLNPKQAYMPALVVLLIIAAFLLGMLTTKVQYLEKNGNSQTIGTTQTAPTTAAPNVPAAPAPGARVTMSNGDFPIKGTTSAKVHIVEFADLRCPFCEQFFKNTEPQIISDYVNTGKATFAFRQYPFLGPASTLAANAAECANDQGKFWDFHDYMYNNQPNESDTSMYTVANLTQIAGTLGMDTNQFNTCLSTNQDDQKASADLAFGQKSGVTGTPTIFVNGLPIVGAQPYSAFKTIIDQELAKTK